MPVCSNGRVCVFDGVSVGVCICECLCPTSMPVCSDGRDCVLDGVCDGFCVLLRYDMIGEPTNLWSNGISLQYKTYNNDDNLLPCKTEHSLAGRISDVNPSIPTY